MAKRTKKRKKGRKLKGRALASARKNIKKARAARRNKPKRRRTRKKSKPKTKRRKSRRSQSSKKTKSKKTRKRDMVFGKNFLSNPTLKKAAIGVGTGTIAATALAFIAPQLAQNPLIKTGIAFLAGGPIGGIASLLLGGGLNIFGGGNGGTSAGAGAA